MLTTGVFFCLALYESTTWEYSKWSLPQFFLNWVHPGPLWAPVFCPLVAHVFALPLLPMLVASSMATTLPHSWNAHSCHHLLSVQQVGTLLQCLKWAKQHCQSSPLHNPMNEDFKIFGDENLFQYANKRYFLHRQTEEMVPFIYLALISSTLAKSFNYLWEDLFLKWLCYHFHFITSLFCFNSLLKTHSLHHLNFLFSSYCFHQIYYYI